jgi:PTH1 family peptidyl-tRNA hydrolase
MYILFGLGNNEKKYSKSRHNFGHMLIDAFGEELSVNEKLGLAIGRAETEVEKIILVKSTGYMNESGLPAAAVLNFFKLKPKDLIVVHDDIDIDFGKVQQKFGGHHAGHNGIKSIIKHLKTEDFYRLRLGIRDLKFKGKDTDKYVMADFSKDQFKYLPEIIKKAEEVVKNFSGDLDKKTHLIVGDSKDR